VEGLAGLIAMAAFACGVAGLRLVRDPGPEARFAEALAGRDTGGPAPRGPLTRLLDALGRRGGGLLRGYLADPRRAARARRRIDAAGRAYGIATLDDYVRRRGAFLLLAVVLGVLLALGESWLALLPVAYLGWFGVDVLLDGAGRRRQAQIDRDLPDFLDILAVCAGAGIAFRPALQRVAEATGGPLGEEVELTLRQIALGAPRREAFVALRERNPSEPLGTFVSSFLQAEELGVPLAEALTDLARDMRRDSAQRARRRAQNTVPRVSLVVVVTILPAAVMLLVASLLLNTDLGGFGG
jgi:tight adherence protein C